MYVTMLGLMSYRLKYSSAAANDPSKYKGPTMVKRGGELGFGYKDVNGASIGCKEFKIGCAAKRASILACTSRVILQVETS